MDKAERERLREEINTTDTAYMNDVSRLDQIMALLDHIDALEQDKLRLDHLEKHYPRAAYQSDVGEVLGLWPASGYTIREQVDKAIAAAPEI